MRKTARSVESKRGKRGTNAAQSEHDSFAWIRTLAAPYLQGYKPVRVNDGALNGFWFCSPARQALVRLASPKPCTPPIRGQAAGFFVGYVESVEEFSFLNVQPPECTIFAWVQPIGGTLHSNLVVQKGSLLRTTFEYIRWLTHRPPRFVFHDTEIPTMMRHQSMRDWPENRWTHLSRNFYIETLAWLVRSGLVRKLREQSL